MESRKAGRMPGTSDVLLDVLLAASPRAVRPCCTYGQSVALGAKRPNHSWHVDCPRLDRCQPSKLSAILARPRGSPPCQPNDSPTGMDPSGRWPRPAASTLSGEPLRRPRGHPPRAWARLSFAVPRRDSLLATARSLARDCHPFAPGPDRSTNFLDHLPRPSISGGLHPVMPTRSRRHVLTWLGVLLAILPAQPLPVCLPRHALSRVGTGFAPSSASCETWRTGPGGRRTSCMRKAVTSADEERSQRPAAGGGQKLCVARVRAQAPRGSSTATNPANLNESRNASGGAPSGALVDHRTCSDRFLAGGVT